MLNHREKPFITVVIPAFNEERFLAKTLESVNRQNFDNFEVVVVDNNSCDNTPQIARAFGAKVMQEFRRGVGCARQCGFMAAKGEIIATTDADTVVPEDWLSRFAKEFREDKDLAAFGGLCRLSTGSFFARLAARHLLYPFRRAERFFSGGWILQGSNLAVRKESFLRIGGFNTKLLIEEDVDISQRLRAVGKVKLDPKFLVLTSGRRYRLGLLPGLLAYAPNVIMRLFFKKKFPVPLPIVRAEKTFLSNFAFVPYLFLICFFLILFYSSNPNIVQARGVKFIRAKFFAAESTIKKEGLQLGNKIKLHSHERRKKQ